MPAYGQKKQKLPGFPRLPDAGRPARVTRFRKFASFPEGPELYNVYGRTHIIPAWGEPAAGFVTGTTSKTEWAAFWAAYHCAKSLFGFDTTLMEAAAKLGVPPFFSVQIPLLGGRTIRGGAVIDMTFNVNGLFILIRVVTQHYHINTTSDKLARDENQLFALSKPGHGQIVVDVLERDIITDLTGQGAINTIWKALRGQSSMNPAMTGTSRRIIPV